jgi:RNA polymerase sigma-70 factor (ECF subfamily)
MCGSSAGQNDAVVRSSYVQGMLALSHVPFERHRDLASSDADAPADAIVDDFAAIYEMHYRDVYRYVLGRTRSRVETEEITSEVFERAFRAWRRTPYPARPNRWLLLTARRIATDRWRRARRLVAVTSRLRPQVIDDETYAEPEFWQWFEAVAAVLPDRQREVLVLRYQRDLTDDDIGAIMEISMSGVRSLVARALSTLRNHPDLL